jgi:SAM-dependent methyltransferase
MLAFASAHAAAGERYVRGDALALPFRNGEFDYCISVAALCFIADETSALAEMFRVTRRRLALGLLNRRSILYLQKGRRGGTGAYRGAHWHAVREVRQLFSRMPCQGLEIQSAVFLPSGGPLARAVERAAPRGFPLGALLAVCANVKSRARDYFESGCSKLR